MNLEDILKKVVGHKVTLTFVHREEPTLRETTGILKDFDQNMIHMIVYNNFGEKENYYMNRHACTLLSVIEEGKAKGKSE